MKKFLLAVIGTQGDLNPLLGIAQELVRRGHGVTVAANGSHRRRIARLGLDYLPLRPALDDKEGARWFEYGLQSHVKEYRHLFRDLIFPHVAWNFHQLEKVAPAHDVLLSYPAVFSVPLVAKKLGKPWASFMLMPMGYPAEYSRHRTIGRTSSWDFLWQTSFPLLLEQVVRFLAEKVSDSWAAPFRELRQALNLPADLHPITEVQHSPYLNLALFSRHFATAQKDWPQPLVQTGWVFARQENESLSKKVRDFLAQGEPPLLFFPGSMGYVTSKGKPFCQTAAEATLLMDKRAIFIIEQGADNPPDLPHDERLLLSTYEPFSQLLPHISTFVHISGMGSVFYGLHAGKPQLAVPFTYEQCDNALRLEELGVSATIPVARFNTAALCHNIEQMEQNACRERALQVQARLAGENGAAVAADHLEALLSGATAPTLEQKRGRRLA